MDYNVENRRWDPLTAGASATLGTITDFTSALGGTFIDPFKEVKRVRGSGGTGGSASGAAALAASKGVAGMAGAAVKGTLIDVPLALSEGMRNTSKLMGDEMRDHGRVTDWKSGSTVAAKVREPPLLTFSE